MDIYKPRMTDAKHAVRLYRRGKRAHIRVDFEYIIIRGRTHFGSVAYACVITESTYKEGLRALYHVELFYAPHGKGAACRAEARRYGAAIINGKSGIGGYRSEHVPCEFNSAGLPKPESKITIDD